MVLDSVLLVLVCVQQQSADYLSPRHLYRNWFFVIKLWIKESYNSDKYDEHIN